MESSSESTRKKQLQVVYATGMRQRFLRGMITHDLVQRGVDFDHAYAVAQTIRDYLDDRDEVTTAELRDLIQQQLEKIYGGELSPTLRRPARPLPDIRVLYRDQEQPFSRGLLARSIEAADVGLERAYALVTELETQLRHERTSLLPSSEVVRRVAELLERMEGKQAARRYRMMRRLHRLSRPLVIYVGGVAGTGKSTLALELAPLLGIHRVSATDTIRQVMRMVFTPSILPALHSSSFEAAGSAAGALEDSTGSPHDPEFAQRLIDTFEEQATRVCVGVRAVVERAIGENTNILIEGVHLHPALVPFPGFEGLAHQVPLFLTTLDEEIHRARFLSRARTSGRMAERYLENFESIRFLHDYLLQQIEVHDQPLLVNSNLAPTVSQTLRVVTGILEREAPFLGSYDLDEGSSSSPVLVLIIDGLADRPSVSLGGRTPLQVAETPTFDRLATEGTNGLADVVGSGEVADTAAGTLAILSQSPLSLQRGPLEAVGAEFVLGPNDVALRGNLATIDDNGTVIDRRAGRIRDDAEKLAKVLNEIKLPGEFSRISVGVRAATEHRLAIVLRGEGLSSAIIGSDPGEAALPSLPLVSRPLDDADEKAVFTATALAAFEEKARGILANHPVNRIRRKAGLPMANAVITRGAGRIHQLLPLEEEGTRLKVSCISGDLTVIGLARILGARILTSPEMTANLDTDLKAKFSAAKKALRQDNLVVLHVKGTDIASHDGRPDLKAEFIEKIDAQLAVLLEDYQDPLRVVITTDHATLSEGTTQHVADPVPVVIWGHSVESDDVDVFDEQSAVGGSLQRIPMQQVLGHLFRLT